MIAIIDYKAGNLASVSNALHRIGAEHTITNKIPELDAADKIIFPGVGHAEAAMEALREHGLDAWLTSTTKPVLGICLGMQLLYDSSEEGGDTSGLGLIAGRLKRFDPNLGKVPHMGWNTVDRGPYAVGRKDDELQSTTHGPRSYYFVHSYYAPVTVETTGVTEYNGQRFAAMVEHRNFTGAQFHPEKSGAAGETLLREWIGRR
jgi:imidazole glycerol-phosphate synthase subunit HisH